MSTSKPIIIIDLYGSGVRISDGTNILADSKSYALIESDRSITAGEQAEHLAHLRPRECSTLFWNQLSGNSNTKVVISNAEIAYRHLEYIWNLAKCSNQAVVLITSVTLNKNDLGLLLGICKKLAINVAGIVCNASLAMQHPIDDCKAVFLDLQQQQVVVTELIQDKQEISLKQPSRVINYGFQQFIQNAANSIAKKFVSETRFDPLHNAYDEQQFFDKLPLWLTALNETDSIECKLDAREKHFSIQCHKQTLQIANKKLFKDLAAHFNVLFHNYHKIAIFCSASCKQAFGLQDFLASLPGCAVIQLNEISLCQQAVLYRNEIIKYEKVHFVNALPWQEASEIMSLAFTSGKLSNLSSIPTHALLNGYAHSLQQDLFIACSTDAAPKITLEKRADSLCRITTNSFSVVIQVFNSQHVSLNESLLENTATINIDDVLDIKGHAMNIQFIKVVAHEA